MSEPLRTNLAQVQERVARAAGRAGRQPDEIVLVAVTKKQPVDAIRSALSLGLTDVGENYVSEVGEKKPSVAGSARWHLIGHLQANKAKRAAELFDTVQSIDSVKIAATLGRHAVALGKTLEVLVQVHLGEETTKTGVAPQEALQIAAEVGEIPGLSVRGLMGVAPLGTDPRPWFRKLYGIYEALPAAHRQVLSMGMSGDFEAAIEEGATMIRLGTTLFGSRLP